MTSELAIASLSALAHARRLAAFRLLVQAGPTGVAAGDIARRLATPPNTLSTQLAILSRTGLIRSRRERTSIIYTADFDRFAQLLGFLMKDCCDGRPDLCAQLAEAVNGSLSRAPATTCIADCAS